MTSYHYAIINGKYPWGLSPLLFGIETIVWKILIFACYMLVGTVGFNNNAEVAFWISLIPESLLVIYELQRTKKLGWIKDALINTMHSAGMIKESNYRTIFGYYRVERAPIFILDKLKTGGYMLTFKPNGCPNSTRELLPILQKELLGYEIIPTGEFGTQYIIRKRRMRGLSIDDSFFYH